MVKYIIILIFTLFLQAKNYNFDLIKNAENAYANDNYKKALKLYKQIASNDIINYNIANSYYKLKEYNKAIKYYKIVKQENLQSKVLFNIGNCYAAQKKYKKSLPFFESSLKYKESKEAKFNLKIAKKLLKDKQTQKLCKVTDPFKSNIERELKDFENEKFFKNLKEANNTKTNIKNNLSQNINSVTSSIIEPTDSQIENRIKEKSRSLIRKYKEQKIEKKLKYRELKTLLIPIEKKDKNEH